MSYRTLETLEFVGNAICLDFVNSLIDYDDQQHDYLESYETFLEWCLYANVLSKDQVKILRERTLSQTRLANRAFNQILEFRALVKRVLSSFTTQQKPNDDDLEKIKMLFAQAVKAAKLKQKDDGLSVQWQDTTDLNTPLHKLVNSMFELLISSGSCKLKACPGCGWMFLDTSKNGLRRWCSMNTCGSRDKMKRYYQRGKPKSN